MGSSFPQYITQTNPHAKLQAAAKAPASRYTASPLRCPSLCHLSFNDPFPFSRRRLESVQETGQNILRNGECRIGIKPFAAD